MPTGFLREPVTRVCGHCGNAFLATKSAEKLCSESCKAQSFNEAAFRSRIWGKFNLTPEQYEELRIKQGDRCAICRTDDPGQGGPETVRRWCVDHDHTTGKVRGLLCYNCNKGLGLFQDNWQIILTAAAYVSGSQA